MFNIVNDIEAKQILQKYLTELYEQIRIYDKIFNHNKQNNRKEWIKGNKILTKNEEIILKHIAHNLKKLNIINEGRWIYNNLEKETRLILEYIYSKNYTWEGVQLELGVSKSTISRKRSLAEEVMINRYIKKGLIKNEKELEFYFAFCDDEIEADIGKSNKELQKFLSKMDSKYDSSDNPMIYYENDIMHVHVMEDEQLEKEEKEEKEEEEK